MRSTTCPGPRSWPTAHLLLAWQPRRSNDVDWFEDTFDSRCSVDEAFSPPLTVF